MNVCGPANAGGPCGNALVCQYNAKTTNFVAKIAVYDGYFGPRLTLLDGNNPGAGVQAHYLNGDICFLGPTKKRNPRTTIVSLSLRSNARRCAMQAMSKSTSAGGCTADSLRCAFGSSPCLFPSARGSPSFSDQIRMRLSHLRHV